MKVFIFNISVIVFVSSIVFICFFLITSVLLAQFLKNCFKIIYD